MIMFSTKSESNDGKASRNENATSEDRCLWSLVLGGGLMLRTKNKGGLAWRLCFHPCHIFDGGFARSIKETLQKKTVYGVIGDGRSKAL
jgi:hypothetical protein